MVDRYRCSPPSLRTGIPAAGARGSCPPQSAYAKGRYLERSERYPAVLVWDRSARQILQ